MNIPIGFIGCGNMAAAMIGGIIKSELIKPSHIYTSNTSYEKLHNIHEQYGINITQDNKLVAQKADIIVLAVKPHKYEYLMQELHTVYADNKIYVSIAPGKTLAFLEEGLGTHAKIVRTMPNTPALVGAGITAICPNKNVTNDDLTTVISILNTFGKTEQIEEALFDAIVAVSGSSPAYIFMLIEAMSDAGVMQGLPRKQAYLFAAQAVLGSAKMVLDTAKHPAELKDMVCSPGGTTIEAVAVLEKQGFRAAVIDAMTACAQKSKQI
ncbi:MAG: pyrroline-5-carboxylate reductase [Treponema sp.]